MPGRLALRARPGYARRVFALLTTRRRWGLALATAGLALYAVHDRAMGLVTGTAGERAMGTTIGLLVPAALVVGGYLVVTPEPLERAREKRKSKRKRIPLPSDRADG